MVHVVYTYDKINKTYGVTSDNLIKRDDLVSECNLNIIELLDQLDSRTITGHTAISTVNGFIQKNPTHKQLVYNIIDRDLKTRVTGTIINKVWKGLIPEFKVALADSYKDKEKFVDYKTQTWFSSRKLDGCLEYNTIIEFEDGRKIKIGEVVDNKISGKIKSYNTKTNKIEYKTIKDWMRNLSDINDDNSEWYEIELSNGNKITLTGNHRVWVNNLKCWRRTDELEGTEILLIS